LIHLLVQRVLTISSTGATPKAITEKIAALRREAKANPLDPNAVPITATTATPSTTPRAAAAAAKKKFGKMNAAIKAEEDEDAELDLDLDEFDTPTKPKAKKARVTKAKAANGKNGKNGKNGNGKKANGKGAANAAAAMKRVSPFSFLLSLSHSLILLSYSRSSELQADNSPDARGDEQRH
jgi:hypothetical protein